MFVGVLEAQSLQHTMAQLSDQCQINLGRACYSGEECRGRTCTYCDELYCRQCGREDFPYGSESICRYGNRYVNPAPCRPSCNGVCTNDARIGPLGCYTLEQAAAAIFHCGDLSQPPPENPATSTVRDIRTNPDGTPYILGGVISVSETMACHYTGGGNGGTNGGTNSGNNGGTNGGTNGSSGGIDNPPPPPSCNIEACRAQSTCSQFDNWAESCRPGSIFNCTEYLCAGTQCVGSGRYRVCPHNETTGGNTGSNTGFDCINGRCVTGSQYPNAAVCTEVCGRPENPHTNVCVSCASKNCPEPYVCYAENNRTRSPVCASPGRQNSDWTECGATKNEPNNPENPQRPPIENPQTCTQNCAAAIYNVRPGINRNAVEMYCAQRCGSEQPKRSGCYEHETCTQECAQDLQGQSSYQNISTFCDIACPLLYSDERIDWYPLEPETYEPLYKIISDICEQRTGTRPPDLTSGGGTDGGGSEPCDPIACAEKSTCTDGWQNQCTPGATISCDGYTCRNNQCMKFTNTMQCPNNDSRCFFSYCRNVPIPEQSCRVPDEQVFCNDPSCNVGPCTNPQQPPPQNPNPEPDCSPLECSDGTTHPRCTDDGHPINYFRDPCSPLPPSQPPSDDPPPPEKPEPKPDCEPFTCPSGREYPRCFSNGLPMIYNPHPCPEINTPKPPAKPPKPPEPPVEPQEPPAACPFNKEDCPMQCRQILAGSRTWASSEYQILYDNAFCVQACKETSSSITLTKEQWFPVSTYHADEYWRTLMQICNGIVRNTNGFRYEYRRNDVPRPTEQCFSDENCYRECIDSTSSAYSDDVRLNVCSMICSTQGIMPEKILKVEEEQLYEALVRYCGNTTATCIENLQCVHQVVHQNVQAKCTYNLCGQPPPQEPGDACLDQPDFTNAASDPAKCQRCLDVSCPLTGGMPSVSRALCKPYFCS